MRWYNHSKLIRKYHKKILLKCIFTLIKTKLKLKCLAFFLLFSEFYSRIDLSSQIFCLLPFTRQIFSLLTFTNTSCVSILTSNPQGHILRENDLSTPRQNDLTCLCITGRKFDCKIIKAVKHHGFRGRGCFKIFPVVLIVEVSVWADPCYDICI